MASQRWKRRAGLGCFGVTMLVCAGVLGPGSCSGRNYRSSRRLLHNLHIAERPDGLWVLVQESVRGGRSYQFSSPSSIVLPYRLHLLIISPEGEVDRGILATDFELHPAGNYLFPVDGRLYATSEPSLGRERRYFHITRDGVHPLTEDESAPLRELLQIDDLSPAATEDRFPEFIARTDWTITPRRLSWTSFKLPPTPLFRSQRFPLEIDYSYTRTGNHLTLLRHLPDKQTTQHTLLHVPFHDDEDLDWLEEGF